MAQVDCVSSVAQTYEGIDKCGERLAVEVTEAVAQYPNLERISFLGHSMGGLIARHAIGKLYDSQTRLMAGLKPAHFVSMAAPHLGCSDAEGPAQVSCPTRQQLQCALVFSAEPKSHGHKQRVSNRTVVNAGALREGVLISVFVCCFMQLIRWG